MKAKPTVQIDDDRVIVTEWCFAPEAPRRATTYTPTTTWWCP